MSSAGQVTQNDDMSYKLELEASYYLQKTRRTRCSDQSEGRRIPHWLSRSIRRHRQRCVRHLQVGVFQDIDRPRTQLELDALGNFDPPVDGQIEIQFSGGPDRVPAE